MRLDELLSDMIASGATLDQVRAVVTAHRFREDARADARRERTAERVRRFRERKKMADAVTDVTHVTHVTGETRYTPFPSGKEGSRTLPENPTLSPSPSLRSGDARAHAHEAAGFDEFWEAYPHKVGKADARKSFERVRKAGTALADVLTGVGRYVSSKPPDRQWCNPATWLNQGRWQDEPGPEPINGHHARAGPVREKRNPFIAAIEAEFAEDLFRS